ncbi:hypothetical protein DPMN_029040 [Dreissena polymorpha]|uniref:Uncharacterized protein n=1 Tax=Dreissena polymorpha TaxID=45954 RepID=A0A9D4LYF9_DREPO|nr:hypothetical protein DPMN_029040 [Dreissena polymorpha]
MMLALAAVNTPPPTDDVLSFWCTVRFGGNTSLDRIAFLSGSAPGFTPRSQDYVPHIRSGLIKASAAMNYDLLVRSPQQ